MLKEMNKDMQRSKHTFTAEMTEALDFEPTRIMEVELGQPLHAVSALDDKTGQIYRRVSCLVRLHTQPLGIVELELDESGMNAKAFAQRIWSTLQGQINEHLQQDGLPPVMEIDAMGLPSSHMPKCLEERERFLAHAPFVSVIVATHDRPDQIRRCLRALLSLHYPCYEVIVVDNAPSTSAAADFIQQTYQHMPQVRYLCEDHPGLSRARNCGMMAARGDILAITDDDVVLDPYWLVELVRGFSLAEDVACVTGLVLPLELETPAQLWLEQSGGYSKGFTRRIFDMKKHHPKSPLYPYTAGQFGTGANMAFTTAFLRSINGFDPALGAGTPTRGAEELAAFFQVITQGYKLVYEPAALLYHPHRRDYASLQKQMYNHGIGLPSYLIKSVLDNPRLLLDFISKLPYGLYFTLSPQSAKNRKKSTHYPRELTTLELKGMLHGPFVYLRSRWTRRNLDKTFASASTPTPMSVEKES